MAQACRVCFAEEDLLLIKTIKPRNLPFSVELKEAEYRCLDHQFWLTCSFCYEYFDSAKIKWVRSGNFAYPAKLCEEHQNFEHCLKCNRWRVPLTYKNLKNKCTCKRSNSNNNKLLRSVLIKSSGSRDDFKIQQVKQLNYSPII